MHACLALATYSAARPPTWVDESLVAQRWAQAVRMRSDTRKLQGVNGGLFTYDTLHTEKL
jgi:hypothetical protein